MRALTYACGVLFAMPAAAFNLQTTVTTGCHEAITRNALEHAGWPDGAVAHASTREDQALRDNVPFDAEDIDPWELALLIGVRDPDLHGVAPTDFPAFAAVHQSATFQEEHCLRAPEDDGDDADEAAIARCRAFIVAEIELALGEGEQVDVGATTLVRVSLVGDTRADVAVSRFAFHMGRAVHALQDSFTHTLRRGPNGASGAIAHVLNYVDPATDRQYDQTVDGHHHESSFDLCGVENFDRLDAAMIASGELLAAVADGGGGKEGRLAAVARVLDAELAVDTTCVASNGWCGAVEWLPESCNSGGGATPALLALALGGLLFRRRRAASRSIAVGVSLLLVSSTVLAAEPPRAFALNATTALAVDKGGAALGVGARWRASERPSFGVNLEVNPWFDLLAGSVKPGVATGTIGGTLHWADLSSVVGIESALSLGASVLLFDSVGANAGDAGPNVGLSLIAVRFPINDSMTVLLEPTKLVLAVPHLGGVPLAYRQYQFAVSLDWLL